MNNPASRWEIRPAQPRDQKTIHSLLSGFKLPLDGLNKTELWVLQSSNGQVTGVAGLEVFGYQGLLRSVAVIKSLHGQGLGTFLTRRVLAEAEKRGIQEMFLLTTTAAAFFEKLGFKEESREKAVGGIANSIEFRSACPKTATFMRLSMNAR